MKEGPDIALLGSLIGDPARANMLLALMSGMALTATELAGEAGITVQTGSTHLSRLESGGLVRQRKQGRHRYFSLADDEVGAVLESMMGLASRKGHTRTRTGPRDPALRKARICYDHLAGELAVGLYDALCSRHMVVVGSETGDDDTLELTDAGRAFALQLGIDIDTLSRGRRPLCRSCLDWSARRSHLAGAFGTAVLHRIYEHGWARRLDGSRVIRFTGDGEAALRDAFGF